MSSDAPSSPYIGLRPYREEDFALFFGRDRDVRVISANLQMRPLTVLYGASGVGKSSVLQAGVVRRLKEEPGPPVFYFREWQSAPILQGILQTAADLLTGDANRGIAKVQPPGSPANAGVGQAYLLLDQFEEFLLYHGNDSLGEQFDGTLARIVNRKDCPVNVLIGIRDDSLYKLDRHFSLRIPNLLRDTVELERMTPEGARSAIEQPLAVYTRNNGNGKIYKVEPELVEEILREVQAGKLPIGDDVGIGTRRGRPKENRIETAYLQLVLTKLWEEELRQNSVTLRLATLRKLKGADNIVRTHVKSVMNQLANSRERDIATNMFRYLVTPSGSKIAQATKDLVSYAERPEGEVKHVLDELTDRSESRILRRISDPEQYEIFHDVLARPLLDYRRAHAEALASRRLWRLIAGAIGIAVLFAAVAAYALVERHRANALAQRAEQAARKNSNAFALAQVTSQKLATVLEKQQTAVQALQQAQTGGAGNEAQVAQLKAQLLQYSNRAQEITQSYHSQRQSLDAYSSQALASVQNASQEREADQQNLAATQKERDAYKAQVAAMQQQIQELRKQLPQK